MSLKHHMTIFQHAAFFPFEVVLLHHAVAHHLHWGWFIAILVAGLVYARYIGGYFAGMYDSLPSAKKVALYRIPGVASLVLLPIVLEYFFESAVDIIKQFIQF